MHKIAEFSINIKHRRPGNVVQYIPVEFEVFLDGEYYKAIPLQSAQSSLLTNLPNELLFRVEDGKIYNCTRRTEEIVEDIVNQLAERGVIEMPEKRFSEKKNKSTAAPLAL